MARPQPWLLNLGDVFVYPTCKGEVINPYFRPDDLRETGWNQDGWGAAFVVDCGRAFDFLAWYRVLTIADALPEKPDQQSLRADLVWTLRFCAGTCPAARYRKIGIEKLTSFTIDPERRNRCFPEMRNGVQEAVDDVCISNSLSIGPHSQRESLFIWRGSQQIPLPSIKRLAEITKDARPREINPINSFIRR
jgi:hypothetical protein